MNQKYRTEIKQNLHLYDGSFVEGAYDIPVLPAVDVKPSSLIGFNYVNSISNRDRAIHFYLDDYQFERVWNTPERYVAKFLEFEAIIGPDFSIYMHMPTAMQVWNRYRSMVLAQYYSNMGITVVPNITFGDRDTYEWCFDGMPKHSTLAVSSVGCMKNPDDKKMFTEGLGEAIKRLSPNRLLFFGKIPDNFDFGNTEVVRYSDERLERLRKYGKRG